MGNDSKQPGRGSPPRDEFVVEARRSDRSRHWRARPAAIPQRGQTDEQLDAVVAAAAKQRSPTSETGQAG
jgi:hypothetical protein